MKENNGKVAKDGKVAWEIQDTQKGKPHGWLQWKATNAFMEVKCKCGVKSSIDGYFAYYIKCGACGTIYMCNGHIELIEIEDTKSYNDSALESC